MKNEPLILKVPERVLLFPADTLQFLLHGM